ncbi:MAG TPA: erythromycin esterase family protein [Anaerolineae bacterium]
MSMLRSISQTRYSVEEVAEQVNRIEHKLENAEHLDPLMDAIGDARYVLLGEASHGTFEYYTWRARLSQRLIREKGFSFIAVEGDWPACYQVNRYVKAYEESGESAYAVLHAFERWPTWMWANWEVVALAESLRRHNEGRSPAEKVGFYGLDVYSLQESMKAVTDYLAENYPDALDAARRAYRCFEPYGEDVQAYAWSTAMVPETCEDEVIQLLAEVRRKVQTFDSDREAAFNAEQNALVAVEAERYYRTMIRGSAASWNVRDYHMADTLDRLMAHHGNAAKAIVWEHNTHIGDARATDMARAGMVNVGQIVRERHSEDGVVLVGFGSHRGSVIAGQEWGAPMARIRVPRAQSGSWEDVLHQAGGRNKLLLLEEVTEDEVMLGRRGHRAIGVVYHPEAEYGNYVPTVLPHRYDAFLYIDETQALHPLHIQPEVKTPPETYPWGV